MAKSIRALFVLALALTMLACGGTPAETEPAAEEAPAAAADRGSSEVTINDATISVEYGRPTLVEGKVRGQDTTPREARSLATPGYVWRLGMNEATTLKTDKDLSFGDTVVPAGEYTIFARKAGANQWELVFNSALGQWGAFDHDPSKDVASTPLTISEFESPVDQLEIEVRETGESSGEIVIRWGQDEMKATFTVA